MSVSVPCRGLFYFIMSEAYAIELFFYCFRPLPGSFLFHLKIKVTPVANATKVSVPCRGLFYFIDAELEELHRKWEFPSPAGVFFISSQYNEDKLKAFQDLFPSPAGVFFISSLSLISRYI